MSDHQPSSGTQNSRNCSPWRAGGAFTLSVASTIGAEAGGLDYSAPDRFLSQTMPILKGLRQDPAFTSREIADIARSHCRQRMEALREGIESTGQVIDINLQTRIVPSAVGPYGDLVVRLRPSMNGDRRPHRQGLEDLRLFLGDLPTSWRSLVRSAQGSVEERTYRLHSLLAPRCPLPSLEMCR